MPSLIKAYTNMTDKQQMHVKMGVQMICVVIVLGMWAIS